MQLIQKDFVVHGFFCVWVSLGVFGLLITQPRLCTKPCKPDLVIASKGIFFLFWLTYDGFSFIRWTGKLEGKLSLGEISHKERAAPKISRLLWSLADCHSHPLCLHGTPWLVFKHLLIASWVILKTWEGVTQTRNGESSVSKCNLCVSADANTFHQVEL